VNVEAVVSTAPKEALDAGYQLYIAVVDKPVEHVVVHSSPASWTPYEVWNRIHKRFEIIVIRQGPYGPDNRLPVSLIPL
jgi:hypothetical protein